MLTVGSSGNKDQCSACPAGCDHCEDGVCKECSSGQFLNLLTNLCVAQCSTVGAYYNDATSNPVTGVCAACDPACKSCSGPDKNTQCPTCNDGWFSTGSNGCVKCDDKCATCTGTGNEKCITCKKTNLAAGVPGTYFLAPGNKCYDSNERCPTGLFMKDAPVTETDSNGASVSLIAHTCE